MKATIISRVALVIAALALCAAPMFAQDPVKVGPNVYKSIFENERIRVNEINFKVGDKIGMHSHPDHVVYWIEGGTLRIYSPNGDSVDVTGKAGEVLWLSATTHAAMNIGKTNVKAVQVELKEPAPMKADSTKKG